MKYTDKDTSDFEEVISEMQKLTALVSRFMVCVVMPILDPDTGKPTDNFHYVRTGQLIDAPPLLQNKRPPRSPAIAVAPGVRGGIGQIGGGRDERHQAADQGGNR